MCYILPRQATSLPWEMVDKRQAASAAQQAVGEGSKMSRSYDVTYIIIHILLYRQFDVV